MFPAFFVYLQQCNGSGRGATAYRALKIPVPGRTSRGENRAVYVSTSRIGHKAVNLVHTWPGDGKEDMFVSKAKFCGFESHPGYKTQSRDGKEDMLRSGRRFWGFESPRDYKRPRSPTGRWHQV